MKRENYEYLMDLIENIRKLEKEFSKLLNRTLEKEKSKRLTTKFQDLIQQIELELKSKAEKDIVFYCMQINLRNEQYRFIRVIDGDTLIVEPPSELKEWAKDIRIRLYGIDTPEISEKEGKIYADFLHELCEKCAKNNLSITWVRERLGTEYEKFPKSSFERAIGNLFIKLGNNQLLYINSLLAMLPHVDIFRNEKSLLQGQKYFDKIIDQNYLSNLRASELPHSIQKILLPFKEKQIIPHFHLPKCLYIIPNDVFKIAEQNPIKAFWMILENIFQNEYPQSALMKTFYGRVDEIEKLIQREKILPFDILIWLADKWRHNKL